MQQNKPSKGTFIALIIILLLAFGLYFYYSGSQTPSDVNSLETLSSPESVQAQAEGASILTLLSVINSLTIDDSIFKSEVYKSLVDYTIEIPSLKVGRVNPFIPSSKSNTNLP